MNKTSIIATTESTTAPHATGGFITPERQAAHMIARAWSDEDFKKKLAEKPDEAFAEYGIAIPAGKKVRVVEDSPELTHFILPAKPTEVAHMALDRLSTTAVDDQGYNFDNRHSGFCYSGHCRHCGHCYCGCGHCGHCRHSGHCSHAD